MIAIAAHPIAPETLERVRSTGRDAAGSPPQAWADAVGVPLRCCLRRADADDEVILLAHAPLRDPSPWREVGPVFVHAERCDGFDAALVADGLPPDLRSGPRVLRPYRHDGSLHYDAIVTVGLDEDLAPALRTTLGRDDVAEVHVRAVLEQCFTYLVRRGAADGPATAG